MSKPQLLKGLRETSLSRMPWPLGFFPGSAAHNTWLLHLAGSQWRTLCLWSCSCILLSGLENWRFPCFLVLLMPGKQTWNSSFLLFIFITASSTTPTSSPPWPSSPPSPPSPSPSPPSPSPSPPSPSPLSSSQWMATIHTGCKELFKMGKHGL